MAVPKLLKIITIFCGFFGGLLFLNDAYRNSKVPEYGDDNRSRLIPTNLVHYVMFNENTINFITFLSILSAIKVQKPSVIYLHSNEGEFSGKYYEKLCEEARKRNTTVRVSYLRKPTHIYGQKLSSVYHASDVARIEVLQTHGGIFLDCDTLFVNNVDGLRDHDCVIGIPEGQNMGTQFIMAKKEARFLQLWKEGYKKYYPDRWYYNAGEYPTREVWEKDPSLATAIPVYFGVHYLLHKLSSEEKWTDWRDYYAIHLLSRHHDMYTNLNESVINNMTNNFGDIARWILNS